MRYPHYLKEKNTIGFVSPSFSCAIEPYFSAFKNAQTKFIEKGYNIYLGYNCYVNKGIGICNTPQECARELQEMYESDKNDILISCGGGELMCEILPYIDFEKLKKSSPKWFMGYSDNTNFTFLSATILDTAAIYGPCAATFGMIPWHKSLEDCMNLLSGKTKKIQGYDGWELESLKTPENPLEPYNITEKENYVYYPATLKEEGVTIKGRLLGGCMDCLSMLAGTRFDKVKEFKEKYKEDGIIWFLEACDLNVMSIRRVLWQLRENGWFENTKGFLIGRPMHFNEPDFGIDQYQAVTDVLKEFNVPIIMDLDIGHLSPMVPLICGGNAIVSAQNNTFSVEYLYN
ncbi:S66 family peptidase [Lachnobacterium bovis]|uniref:S66 family peptidase n=1 Tax=Lachnobacterium bovis TaxID=140626 RepID=UPI00048C3E35|nr:S66 peptidase family protein [Lachnobacterium bovis]